MPGALWLDLANALATAAYTPRDLREVLTSAAAYLVERPGPEPERVVYETVLRLRPLGPHGRQPFDGRAGADAV